MSNWYLCAQCRNNPDAPWVGIAVDCKAHGITRARVMVDHGHANGRRPYDPVHKMCAEFERREREDA